MGNAKLNNWMQWVLLAGVVAVLLVSFGAYQTASNIPTETPEVPTATDFAQALVNQVEIPTLDTGVLDDICDAVDCDGTDVSSVDENNAINYAEDEADLDDFLELLEPIVGIDEDDIIIDDVEVKEIEVTTSTEDDNEDGNFKVEGFLRVKWIDADDDDDTNVEYVVVTADITDLYDYENDQDVEYSMRKVSRTFEF